jgi:hypothetical protein
MQQESEEEMKDWMDYEYLLISYRQTASTQQEEENIGL